MNILIIEDEPRAANRLERMILQIEPSFMIIGKPESIEESITALNANDDIQLIFSDIELGDGTSFEIFEQFQTDIPIIFTTAYNQYAIEAFKLNGVGYLLKPIDADELRNAIDKFKRTQGNQSKNDFASLTKVIETLTPKSYKNRFLIKVGTKLKSIKTDEIAAFYSMEKGTYLLAKDKRNYAMDLSLDHLMDSLDPEKFFKISRKHIVELDAIDEIHVFSNSRLKLDIKGLENQEVIVAREKVKEFKGWLG